MKRYFVALLCSVLFSGLLLASPGPQPKNKALPAVFVLGDFETSYDALVESYPESLLTACDCTMKSAFAKWLGMLHELDLYANSQNVDIRGVKVWLHVFWQPNGKIEHIAYHLRPNSKPIEADVMENLLEGFMKQYSFPLTSTTEYAHYSTASFPVFGELNATTND